MDVFAVREKLVRDYEEFVRGFLTIRNARIRDHVEGAIKNGLLWPEAWLSLNPAFEPGGEIADLARSAQGTRGADGTGGAGAVLHPGCADIFQIKGLPIRLHRHQRDALELAKEGNSYVVTTGTGSGKSLTYLVPIVDHVLRVGTGGGLKAIIVYPMNALANSQYEALREFLGGDKRVSVARYTSQENDARRREILDEPPDILMTNYVMLDLILTRPHERRRLVDSAGGLRFLVLDELHTYRGRQGADVAMLVRRVREACDSPQVQCVGTSATLSTEGTREQQHEEIAKTATRLFGQPVNAAHVVDESLRRATADLPVSVSELTAAVDRSTPPADLSSDPLASWAETEFGLNPEPTAGPGSPLRLVRRKPRRLREVARELAALTTRPVSFCDAALRATLLAGSKQRDEFGRPLFAFRLHQFVGKGDTVYVSIEAEDVRHVTTRRQLVHPEKPGAILVPLMFCRECGQEYLQVIRRGGRFAVDGDFNGAEDEEHGGYLYVSSSNPWPVGDEAVRARLPGSWLEPDGSLPKNRRPMLPEVVRVPPDGRQLDDLGPGSGEGIEAAFVRAPFRFCLNPSCRVSYESARQQDFAKLSSLGSEGRSSATTVLSSSLLRVLRADEELEEDARKLLAFTDNRQDASLQAGHFNDFVQVSLIRAALHRACVDAGPGGLSHEDLPKQVVRAMSLPRERYAEQPRAKASSVREQADRALRHVIELRLYLDLQRGVRITMPNLEQTGLLVIGYRDLNEAAADDDAWRGTELAPIDSADRERLMTVLLDEMRRGLSVRHEALTEEGFDRALALAGEHLVEQWKLEETDLFVAPRLLPRARRGSETRSDQYVSGRSAYGRYLRQELRRLTDHPMSIDDASVAIGHILEVLGDGNPQTGEDGYGILHTVEGADRRGGRDQPRVRSRPATAAEPPERSEIGYQLKASTLVWKAGDGKKRAADPLRVTVSQDGGEPNRYFVDLYQDRARELAGLSSAEHTAQVPTLLRAQRERDFRNADLSVMFCSPTMELGVDISSLNAVMMRNAPPTPANYAQRSGRAGRQSQPALVVTYCTTGSAHDQYYFARSDQMVAGTVAPPRIDLTNQDLVQSHVQAIWLAECTVLPLGHSLVSVLDAGGEAPTLKLKPEVVAMLSDEDAARRAAHRARRVLAQTPEVTVANGAPWYDEEWVDRTIRRALNNFDEACDRWRILYRDAYRELTEANRVIGDVSASADAVNAARGRHREAATRLDLLRNSDTSLDQSDFYTYRYLASEGFLPGYSFPRLPVSAFVPARRGRQFEGNYLSRPRFLAISEFGPGALVYHEGARYEVYKVARSLRGGDAGGQPRLDLESAKVCGGCGALHPPVDDVCGSCLRELPTAMTNLLRMTTASTIRRSRISSDEEERRRQGFDIRTAIAMAVNGPDRRVEAVVRGSDELPLARLLYADAATLRRMNVGLRRRKSKEPTGYRLDAATGRWARRREQPVEPDDITETAPATGRGAKEVPFRGELVIPYVQDRRNALILDWHGSLPVGEAGNAPLASLQYALKRAVQVVYDLEDSELAAEALPTISDRQRILLYESAEGGAGVLRHLLSDGALDAVARTALGLLHFNLDGSDRGAPDGVDERCAQACYDCLLSYGNQTEHELLDRFAARPLLLGLADSSTGLVQPEPMQTVMPAQPHSPTSAGQLLTPVSGGTVAAWGRAAATERFVGWLRTNGYRLPDATGELIGAADARPDLHYRLDFGNCAVFLDGAGEDNQAGADAADRLSALGWSVIDIGPEQEWATRVAALDSIFGPGTVA
ncbi:DEAD/DEAH box helicase [Frankia sp. AgB1.9]|uniref:DEAD/DEAH box helicase n=1 Tax=unclassified Frankia TaxID=2632575 RepID=UPI0019318A3F|nr:MULTISPECIES: DEAD/DEAH box helicase [unclassified Frankia]MBL7492506.1 DEAD/DEAH box helicase [Frankia sp. AgW1.1]MBL7547581.1 DEAD/DEAH box helicase [Frankia sp. AgB1.9]MBL7619502.1 DEAD/DEAH box helicase [Frankia sp. AgB1.8]